MAGISSQLVFGVFLVLCALLYEFYCPLRPGASNVTEVAVKWKKEIRLPTKNFSRIAIGYKGVKCDIMQTNFCHYNYIIQYM